MRKLHCSSAGGRHPVTCYWMTPTVCMAGLINPQAKPSPRGSLSGKTDTRKWLSVVFTSYPLPFSAIWKGDNGKKSSPLSPSTCLSAKQPAYRAIRFKTAVGSTSANRKHWLKPKRTIRQTGKRPLLFKPMPISEVVRSAPVGT